MCQPLVSSDQTEDRIERLRQELSAVHARNPNRIGRKHAWLAEVIHTGRLQRETGSLPKRVGKVLFQRHGARWAEMDLERQAAFEHLAEASGRGFGSEQGSCG